MAQFTDNAKRDWSLSLNVNVLKLIKRELDVDLLDLAHGSVLDRLANDPALLVDVLYLIAKPQADRQGVTAEQFGEAMVGDALDAASEALVDALVEFLPGKKRALLTKLMTKVKDAEQLMMDRLEQEIDELDLTQLMEGLGGPSTPSPASSDSTPATSR